jgi:multiple sugar transport system ATP-binding protein
MASVMLEGIRKIYEDRGRIHVAVHDVNLHIADGELVVLVGPSGCGKSTTLRMIAGLESITEGRLSIGGRVVNDVPAKDRDIAMVFQNYALYPHMTAYQNMAFALELRRVPRREIDARVREAAATLGIEELLDRRPRQMSGGQRQRVALGRAIVRKPQVFLFDEPLSNLDARLRVQMRREIARLHQQLGTTMVYVTHDQVEAMTLGDRIVVLNEGRVQQIDTPMALYERPRNTFVAEFIGSPPMNLLRGTIERDSEPRFRADGGAFTLALTPEWARALEPWIGREVILGARPEDVHVAGNGAPRDDQASARLRIDLVEPLGGETLLHASAPGHTLAARVPAGVRPPLGADMTLVFDREKLHFFDPDSGERVVGESRQQAAESRGNG